MISVNARKICLKMSKYFAIPARFTGLHLCHISLHAFLARREFLYKKEFSHGFYGGMNIIVFDQKQLPFYSTMKPCRDNIFSV